MESLNYLTSHIPFYFLPGELELEVDSMVGVHAFMPPEYVRLAIVSQKTDVYTFGVLLLALLAGKNASVE